MVNQVVKAVLAIVICMVGFATKHSYGTHTADGHDDQWLFCGCTCCTRDGGACDAHVDTAAFLYLWWLIPRWFGVVVVVVAVVFGIGIH